MHLTVAAGDSLWGTAGPSRVKSSRLASDSTSEMFPLPLTMCSPSMKWTVVLEAKRCW